MTDTGPLAGAAGVDATQVLNFLAQQYGDTWELLLDGADTAMRNLWLEVGGTSPEALALWEAQATALMAGVTQAAAEGAAAWLDLQVSAMGGSVPAASPIVVPASEAVITAPPKRLLRYLGQGLDYADAILSTADYVGRLTSTATRAAEQAGRAARAPDVNVEYVPRGRNARRRKQNVLYVRVPDVRACGWCRVVADRLYTEEGVKGAWHAFCRCTWRLATPTDMENLGQYAGGKWKDVIGERAVADEVPAVEPVEPQPAPVAGQFPDTITTTPEGLAWMRQAHPGTTWDIPDDWPADTVLPTLRQYDRLAVEWPDTAARIKRVHHDPINDGVESHYAYATRSGTISLNPRFYTDPDGFRASLDGAALPIAGTRQRTDAYLKQKFPGLRPRASDATNWLHADSVESVLTHEFGHHVKWTGDAVYDALRAAAAPKPLALFPDLPYVGYTDEGHAGVLREAYAKALADKARAVSVYARTNLDEAFAETFTAIYHDGFRVEAGEHAAAVEALRKYHAYNLNPRGVAGEWAGYLTDDMAALGFSDLGELKAELLRRQRLLLKELGLDKYA